MTIKNHLLEGVSYLRTPNGGKPLTPVGVVMHDTAGRSFSSSVRWLTNPAAKASAHLVIGRDGEIVQLMPFNKQTWHAGRSSYKGREGCNGFTIGIELDNPGKLDATGRAWFGTIYDTAVYGIQFAKTEAHGSGYWMPYSQAQMNTVQEVLVELFNKYALEFLTAHWVISPGRKIDTNPLFPLERLQGLVAGRNFDRRENDPHVRVDLNLRAYPGVTSRVIMVMNAGSTVEIIRSAEREDGRWYLVKHQSGETGWCHSNYLELEN